MSVRLKGGKYVIELYDPVTKAKRYLTQREIRELGFDPPTNERQARRVERAALNARDKRRPGTGDETVGSFASRWPTDYTGRGRGESTRLQYADRVKAFAARYGDRTMRSILREEGRAWANEHASTVSALRAMFADAIDDRIADENPFARLGLKQRKGREDIVVLSRDEIDELKRVAIAIHGDEHGAELAAMIDWGAYTCVRPGEMFAARYSLLDGDVYHLQAQFHSRLAREMAPKHGGTGTIYVPEPAQRAVLDKPRRLGDDLIFRTKRGHQFRLESLNRAWAPVRAAFTMSLPSGHHLRQRLAVDPDDRLDFYELRHFGASYMLNVLGLEPWVIAEQLRHSDGGRLVLRNYGHPSREEAINRIRRAFTSGENVKQIRSAQRDAREDVG